MGKHGACRGKLMTHKSFERAGHPVDKGEPVDTDLAFSKGIWWSLSSKALKDTLSCVEIRGNVISQIVARK